MIRLILCVMVLMSSALPAADGPMRGDVVLSSTFGEARLPADWNVQDLGRTEVADGVLAIEATRLPGQMVRIPLPLERVRGGRVTLSARVKAENVAKPPRPWNGVKLMLHTVSPAGAEYQSPQEIRGTFDWRHLGVSIGVPNDATEAWVFIGLEETTGRAWFDDLTATVTAVPRKRPATRPVLSPPEQQDRRMDVPRLRGVMYGPQLKSPDDLRTLAAWNGNHIRWQFYWWHGTFEEHRYDLEKFDQWMAGVMAEVDRALPLCEELGIRVLIDLHTPPGGSHGPGQWPLFSEAKYQEKFLEAWDKLARHYKDQPAVWGYDLLNEPSEGLVRPGLLDWRDLAETAARRVRAIDPHKAIIVEPGPHGGWANLPFFEPIDVPGIVYSVHMYDPIRFTHQGVLEGFNERLDYPGQVEGRRWDRAALRDWLKPVREYQLDYGVPIYIGEFSAARWAPGESAATYLRDCIAIFEEYGWDWCYHAFREWHGWNVEIGPEKADESPSTQPTSRQRALMEGFKTNQRRPIRR